MVKWVDSMRKYNLIIVKSNHDEFLDKWIINGEWKMNIQNALEYVNYAKLLLDGTAENGIIPYVLNQRFSDVKTLNVMKVLKLLDGKLEVMEILVLTDVGVRFLNLIN